ncbi:similar to Saccharomyces cerevisiae YGL197W MDS3 Putative component of the TOR regulatory pathway [Maudiozyma saulgeensis]|uniref:Similar to Saccharomyces cerevisiae YGL197W MDS3 Putative component of the TOR regulatory pathway n=1 Tax=Maudiozyma saulgeensis TaxID=1789683 RepID=A0A1X7R0N8_9SACH|nr:similar to Saccharomyces cerevisiae YGL197W MDS3 Putative component of the TOR regulatory pathway [Kazachstania saulgeensis]
MPTLQPSTSTCYKLKLPDLPPELRNKNIDETVKRRYTLDCRTGAATEICRSSILVHGGLTIPLNISHITISEIQNKLILYFAKRKHSGANFKNLQDWISNELFSLDLITREWFRISTTNKNSDETIKERLLHSMCYYNNNLYMFGGLIVSPQNDYELIATNELWKLDLQTMEWSLIGKDPQITRRFNHTMLLQGNNDEKKDTKLIIVGGLNNMDQSIPYIDVFNISTNAWESVRSSNRIITNIEGSMVSLCKNKNGPVLLQDNEAEIPTLAYYMPLSQQKRQLNLHPNDDIPSDENSPMTSDSDSLEDENKILTEATSTFEEDSKNYSPIIALPLLSNAQGVPLISNQDEIFEQIQNTLHYESASYFNDNFILIGTTTVRPQAKLYCFFYNLHFSKWTMININCPDCDITHHRFWKVFTWESHYQALLLGTLHDDFHTSSVQKFDHLLAFGLSMTNVLNRAAILPDYNQSRNQSLSMAPTTPSNLENNPFQNPIRPSTSTSQFESYIKYITTPLDIEATTSVFPPYAMVLGKDGFDIYGDSFADFEFITNEGESVGVPSYLLRKRWGRYFDRLLSKSYSTTYATYSNTGHNSSLVKPTSDTIGDIPETSILKLHPTNNIVSQTSLDSYFKETENDLDPKSTPNYTKEQSVNLPPISKNKMNYKLSPTSSLYNIGATNNSQEVVNVIPTHLSNNRYEEFKNYNMSAPTTSSTSGMVFRVPFHDKKLQTTDYQDSRTSYSQNNTNNRRRSSLVVQFEGETDPTVSKSPGQYPRRASHPTQWNPSFLDSNSASPKPSGLSVTFNSSSITNGNNVSNRRPSWRMMSSTHNSRKASVTSQSSIMSFVSSKSDRMGNSVIARRSTSASGSNRSSRSTSPNPVLLNVALPPLSNIPDDPIPSTPAISANIPIPQNNHRRKSTASRAGSFAEVFGSNRGSPFSSRRSSRVRHSSSVADSNSSMHSPRYSIDDAKFFISPTRTRRMSSCTSNEDSLESLGTTDGGRELEPLLTPRSLYLPWPTVTVQAFVEFFYTGQINKKWLLAPVVMDLLVMAKIYEIPLLYEMICEVIYAIIGKKEENLHYNCNSIERGFNQLVANYFQDDEAKITKFLENNEAYRQLQNLKKSLNDIDDGFLVMKLLSDLSRNLSTSTNEESDNNDTVLSHDDLKSIQRSLSNASLSRDLHQTNDGNLSTRPHQNSNISTGLSSLINNDNNEDVSASLLKKLLNQSDSISHNEAIRRDMELAAKDRERRHSSNSSLINKRVNDEELEQARLQGLSEVDYGFSRDGPMDSKSLKKLYSMYEDDNHNNDNKTKIGEIDKNSSQSDSDEIDSQFDGLSKIKMKRQLLEDFELDESIDPLYRFSESEPDAFGASMSRSDSLRASGYGNATRGSKTSKSTLYKGSFLKNASLHVGNNNRNSNNNNNNNNNSNVNGTFKNDKKPSDAESGTSLLNLYNHREPNMNITEPTLENIISTDALPPVDYIMKSICRTTVLVNDPRIMIRSMECIELSKLLKLVKKKMSHEVQLLEDKTKKNEKTRISNILISTQNGHRSSINAVPNRKEGSTSIQTLPKIRTMSSIPNFKLKQISNNNVPIDPSRRKSSKLNSISPRTSLSVITSNNSINNSIMNPNHDINKISMHPPFIPSTMSNVASPKSKKDSKNSLSNNNNNSNSNNNLNSGFSFFGKKK